MDIPTLIQKAKDSIETLKKQSFGNRLMVKKSLSTLERLMIYASIGLLSFVLAIFFVIVPGVEAFQITKNQITQNMNAVYGKVGEGKGLKYVNQLKQKELQEKEEVFRVQKSEELEKLDQALRKSIEVYDIAVLLEDYAVTFHTEQKPIIVSNVSFGKMEKVITPPGQLKQEQGEKKVSVPAEYRILPLTVTIEAHREKFEQFLEFVYHSGDTVQYLFKGTPVPVMSIESLNLPVEKVEDVKSEIETYSIKMNFYLQKEELLEKKTTK